MKLKLGNVKSTAVPYTIGKKSLGGKKLTISKKLDDQLWNTAQEQIISSAKTSRPQISAANKKLKWNPRQTNLDLGGGKYNQNTDYLAQQGVSNLVYDPFNRSKKENLNALRRTFRRGGADTVTNHNVLNVIQSAQDRAKVLRQGKQGLRKKGSMYISVYEGAKPAKTLGSGTTTSNGWQNNARTDAYLDEVKSVFGDNNVTYDKKNKIIVARKFNMFLCDIAEFNRR